MSESFPRFSEINGGERGGGEISTDMKMEWFGAK